MQLTELLAESDFSVSVEVIVFLIVILFSFLKWLFSALIGTKNQQEESNNLEDLYQHYREEILQKPSTPPPLPAEAQPVNALAQPEPPAPVVSELTKPRYSTEDIERARRQSPANKSAYARPSEMAKAKRQAPSKQPLHKMLRNKNSLRQALLAKQILSRPKAFSK